MNQSAEQLRAKAAQHDQDAFDSFERCDTDGFISQWASSISAREARLEAVIIDNGGVAEFPALFTLDGEWVPARRIETRYGMRWQLLEADGRTTGTFLPYRPARRNTLAKHGYVEGYVARPAKAAIVGGGKGLAGAATCMVAPVPTDRDWDEPAQIICVDLWADEEAQ